MNNKKFILLAALLVFIVVVNLFILYIPELKSKRGLVGSEDGSYFVTDDDLDRVAVIAKNIERNIRRLTDENGYSVVDEGDDYSLVPRKRRIENGAESKTKRPKDHNGTIEILKTLKEEERKRNLDLPEFGLLTVFDFKRTWLIKDPDSYARVFIPVLLANQTIVKKKKVRYWGRFFYADHDEYVLSRKKGNTSEKCMRFVVEHDDFTNNIVLCSDDILAMKVRYLIPGEIVQLFGVVHYLQGTTIIIIHDIIPF